MINIQVISECLKLVFQTLNNNRFRTTLSLTGIAIGIITITSILTAVDTLKNDINNNLEKLGTRTIFLKKMPMYFNGDAPWWRFIKRPLVSIKEYKKLANRLNYFQSSAYLTITNGLVLKYLNNSVDGAYMLSGTHSLNEVYPLDIELGRYFSDQESSSGKNVIIIGNEVANGLFKDEYPIGKLIKIKGVRTEVIGVLRKEGTSIMKFSDNDNSIFVPFNFAKNLININSERYDPQIMLIPKLNVSVDEAEAELLFQMRAIRRLKPDQENNFSIDKMTMVTKQFDGLFLVLNTAGWIIGGFSILVGGFGISNIMFVSVNERVNIIGIQKALGAKKRHILFQYLSESIVLCLTGGLVGLLIVWLITLLLNNLGEIPISLDSKNCLTAMILSCIIGAIAGGIPAYNAANLSPSEAIRSK